jgi:hypothetical protein
MEPNAWDDGILRRTFKRGYLVVFGFILACPSSPVWAAEAFRYPFLRNLNLSEIKNNKRVIYIIGEKHTFRVEESGKLKEEQDKYKRVRAEILKAIKNEKILYMMEDIHRDPAVELDYARRSNLKLEGSKGAVRGLEDSHIKLFVVSRLVNMATGLTIESAQQARANPTEKNIRNVEELLEDSWKLLLQFAPLLLTYAHFEPMKKYWNQLKDVKELKARSVFHAMVKTVEGLADPDSTADPFAIFEKTYMLDPRAMPQIASVLNYISQDVVQKLISDESISLEKRKALSVVAFNKKPAKLADIIEFLRTTSPLREAFMVQSVLEGVKDYPDHDLMLRVGEAHRLPLEKAIRISLEAKEKK